MKRLGERLFGIGMALGLFGAWLCIMGLVWAACEEGPLLDKSGLVLDQVGSLLFLAGVGLAWLSHHMERRRQERRRRATREWRAVRRTSAERNGR